MSEKRTRRGACAAALVCVAWLVSCDGTNLIGPENQLEVTNVVDSFQWQVSDLDDVSQTLTYAWQNTGNQADVNQSVTLTSGSAFLRIEDSSGDEVYSRSLAENGTFSTAAGSGGTWTITVTLDRATGTLNFRVQRP